MILESQDNSPGSDPVATNPTLYRTVFENDRVRVLEYRDVPGDVTTPHRHPDSVMVTLSGFSRRVSSGGEAVDVELPAGQVRWLGAQEHVGENVGGTETHVVLVELKETPRGTPPATTVLGPTS
jgi:hypothetical protein